MSESDPIEEYYDPMVEDYHLLFEDWRQTIREHGEVLDRQIRAHLGTPPEEVLDCACGIGTQAIGLALRGYRVHATDLSPAAVARTKREALKEGVSLTTAVADIRALESEVPEQYAVALACDNALPHSLTDEELDLELHRLFSRLKNGGLLLATMRDYDEAIKQKPRFVDPHVYDDPVGKRVVYQLWDWREDCYEVRQFITQEEGSEWRTRCYVGEYRALQRDHLSEMLGEAGFTDIRWQLPQESGYYQPMVTARRP